MNATVEGLRETLIDGVRTIRIDRPSRANALTRPMMARLADAFVEPTRATILAGGAIFCSGVDTADIADDDRASGRAFFAMLEAAALSPAPLIAAIEGPAVGGGWLLAACADRIFATIEARFHLPEIRIGIPPFVAHPLLHDSIGSALWARAALGGEEITAGELARSGATELSADPPRDGCAVALLLARNDPASFARLKLFARQGMIAGIREAKARSFAHIGAPADRPGSGS